VLIINYSSQLLKEEYETMLTQVSAAKWVNDTHWVPHPVTYTTDPDNEGPPQTRSRSGRRHKKTQNNATSSHKSGCARTEGEWGEVGVAARSFRFSRPLVTSQVSAACADMLGLREGGTRGTSYPGTGCTGARDDESTHAKLFYTINPNITSISQLPI